MAQSLHFMCSKRCIHRNAENVSFKHHLLEFIFYIANNIFHFHKLKSLLITSSLAVNIHVFNLLYTDLLYD